MINNYFRPKNIEEALILLSQPHTHPLGGGTSLNQPSPENFNVVDLQALNLSYIHKHGQTIEIGATTKLQQLTKSNHIPFALIKAIELDTTLNIRNMATVAGKLVSCNGRSAFATATLALDPKIIIAERHPFADGDPSTQEMPESSKISLGDLLPIRENFLTGKLIITISIPQQAILAFESVARTPLDTPIVCVAVAQWSSGRTRITLGGYGDQPLLAMDGSDAIGSEDAVRNAFCEASDPWASAEYRSETAAILTRRCLEYIKTVK